MLLVHFIQRLLNEKSIGTGTRMQSLESALHTRQQETGCCLLAISLCIPMNLIFLTAEWSRHFIGNIPCKVSNEILNEIERKKHDCLLNHPVTFLSSYLQSSNYNLLYPKLKINFIYLFFLSCLFSSAHHHVVHTEENRFSWCPACTQYLSLRCCWS